jgi:hypothetical protein
MRPTRHARRLQRDRARRARDPLLEQPAALTAALRRLLGAG